MSTKDPKNIESPPLMEAVQPFVCAIGQFAAGMQLRADHPAVRGYPQNWAVVGDVASRAAAMREALEHNQANLAGDADDDAVPSGLAMSLGPITTYLKDAAGTPRAYSVGAHQLLPVDHPLVVAMPDCFSTVARA
jgi:hypothetical protein